MTQQQIERETENRKKRRALLFKTFTAICQMCNREYEMFEISKTAFPDLDFDKFNCAECNKAVFGLPPNSKTRGQAQSRQTVGTKRKVKGIPLRRIRMQALGCARPGRAEG